LCHATPIIKTGARRENFAIGFCLLYADDAHTFSSLMLYISLSVWIDSVNGERASVTQSTSTVDTGDGRAAQLGMNIERFLLLLFRFPELRPGLRIIHAVVGVK
jgi:hypothetical protein